LAKEGVRVPMSDLFGVGGQVLLDKVHLADAYRVRVDSLRDLIDHINREIAMLEEHSAPYFAGDLGYHAVQTIPGVGPVLAAIFVAEIGDVSRFTSARHLCSWAGLTPTHKESDVTVHRGHITKQGSRLVRWAAVEAVARQRTDTAHPTPSPQRGRTPRHSDRPRGRGAQTSHPRLLRPARRRDPLPGADGVRTGTDAARCELALCHGSRTAAKPRS